MAGLRERKWTKQNGKITKVWELSWQEDGKQRKKTFKKKPTPEEQNTAMKVVSINPTVQSFAKNDYLERNLKLHCKESTLETYDSYYDRYLPPIYNLKLKKIKREDIENFVLNLKKELSSKSVNNVLIFIKGMLNYAVDLKIITENPARKIKYIPLKKQKSRVLNEEQMQCFRDKIENSKPWVNVFLSLLADTGMRISECIALEWSDIDFKNKIISINKQFYRNRLTSVKNYEERDIDLPDFLAELLLEYKKTKSGNLLFSVNNGKHISVSNIREKYFNKFIKEIEFELKCNMNGITPHCLRHTHASTLLSNGLPVKYVSKRLGHKDQSTTLRIYDHLLPSDKEKALNVLNSMRK